MEELKRGGGRNFTYVLDIMEEMYIHT